jgi:hypothetical protein
MKPIILYYNKIKDAIYINASETGSGNVLNLIDYKAHTIWKASSTGIKNIYLEWNSNNYFSAIGLVNHNIRQIEVINNMNDETLLNRTIDNNDVKLFTFPRTGTTEIRIRLTNFTEIPYCGEMILGEYMEFPQPVDAPYSPYIEEPEIEGEYSKTGVLIGVNYKYAKVSANPRFSLIDKRWIEENYIPFWNDHAKLGKPFLFAYDLDNDPVVIYGKINGRLELPREIRNYVNLEFTIEGLK